VWTAPLRQALNWYGDDCGRVLGGNGQSRR